MEAVEEDQDPKSPTGSAYPIITILFFNITNIRLRLRLDMTGVTTMNPPATVGPVQPVARAAAMVTAVARHKIWPIISFLWRRNSLDLKSKVKNNHFHLEIPFCLPGFKRDPSFFHPCTIRHCSRPNHKTWRDLLDRPCLPNQNLMSFILLMKYCQGLSEKHQRDRVAIRFRLRLLLDIIEKIKHTNTNDHQPLTIKVGYACKDLTYFSGSYKDTRYIAKSF